MTLLKSIALPGMSSDGPPRILAYFRVLSDDFVVFRLDMDPDVSLRNPSCYHCFPYCFAQMEVALVEQILSDPALPSLIDEVNILPCKFRLLSTHAGVLAAQDLPTTPH
jgi:hypothetical protein